MEKDSTFFSLLVRMKYIQRWSLMRNNSTENVAEHSLQTAVIAHMLGIISNVYFDSGVSADRLAALAIYHDAAEILTGDLPTPVKYYNDEIVHAYKELEQVSIDRFIQRLPEEMQGAFRTVMREPEDQLLKRLLKAADKISAYVKCLEEKASGNQEFQVAEQTLLSTIETYYDLPAVKFFMEHFLTSFSLTLDEYQDARETKEAHLEEKGAK